MLKASPISVHASAVASAQQTSRQRSVLQHIQARRPAERLARKLDTPVAKVAASLIAETGMETRR